jgi:Response regulator containing CheY-like receiver, AAA-type ATPase, and DNA-binding domains
MLRNKIWVIDDDRAMRWVLEKTFKEEGFDVPVLKKHNPL